MYSGFAGSGTWIPESSRQWDPESLNSIPDSTSKTFSHSLSRSDFYALRSQGQTVSAFLKQLNLLLGCSVRRIHCSPTKFLFTHGCPFSTQVVEFAKKFKFLYMNLKEVDEM